MPITNDKPAVTEALNVADYEKRFDGKTDCFKCNNFAPAGARETCQRGWCRRTLHSSHLGRRGIKSYYPPVAAKGNGCGSFESFVKGI